MTLLLPSLDSQFFIDPTSAGFTSQALQERASKLPNPITLGISRFVIHHQIRKEAILDLVELVKAMAEEARESEEGRKMIEEKKRQKLAMGFGGGVKSESEGMKNMYDGGKRI